MTLLLVEMRGRDRTDDTLWLPVECWLHVLTFVDRRWFYQPHPKPLPPLLAQTSRLWIDAVQLPPMIVRQLFPALSNDAFECVLQRLWHGARMSCDASAHLPFFAALLLMPSTFAAVWLVHLPLSVQRSCHLPLFTAVLWYASVAQHASYLRMWRDSHEGSAAIGVWLAATVEWCMLGLH